MGMTSISPGGGLGGPSLGTGMLSADEARAYADWQNAGGQGDFQYTPGMTPPPQGLPTNGGSAGGKSGGIGNMFSGIADQIINPLMNNIASQAQTPQEQAIAGGLGQAANNFNQTITAPLQQPKFGAPTLGTGMLPAEEARQYAQSQQANTPLPGGGPIGAPPTQAIVGTTPSPVPSMTPSAQQPQAAYNQYANAIFGGGDSIYKPNFGQPQPAPVAQPTNRFAPPNAPGVRTAPRVMPKPPAAVSVANKASPRAFAPKPITRTRVR